VRAGLKAAILVPVEFERQVIAVMELFCDHVREPSDELMALMKDISYQIGRVIERERVTGQMADLIWREQQDLLHTLHDSLGQTLTGLGMLSTALGQQLPDADAGTRELTEQISKQAGEALEQVRRLSNGLFPMEVGPGALGSSIRQLATTTELIHKIPVHLTVTGAAQIDDVRVGTQLHRIVQEAITNVVKHARASAIWIDVSIASTHIRVSVRDDGIGIAKPEGEHEGLGLRIMGHRARSIGAQLRIAPGPDGGTVVTCTWRKAPKHASRRPAGMHQSEDIA
jgi:signal transduction histidine kinase